MTLYRLATPARPWLAQPPAHTHTSLYPMEQTKRAAHPVFRVNKERVLY